MRIQRVASASWSGGLKDGRGSISTESGVLTQQVYGYAMRFEGVRGTNPEELLGAAHVSCFAMALALLLEQAGFKATRLDASVVVTLEQGEGAFSIPAIQLTVKAQVPGIDAAQFQSLAADAKANCPVSKVLRAEISLVATLN
jgi:peroxiredoxin, OsmC subfamily